MKKILIALLTFVSSTGYGQVVNKEAKHTLYSCNRDYVQSEQECESALEWNPESFTDVEKLESAHEFKVIFHSITAYNWNYKGPISGSWNEKLLKNPKIISNNPKISASLITEKKRGTLLGFIGFILEVRPENLVATDFYDAFSPSIKSYNESDLQNLIEYSKDKRYHIRTPDDIIKNTYSYNEVVLTGKPNLGKEIRPTGIIVRCNTHLMKKLNSLSDFEFEDYLKSSCTPFSKEVREQLNQLRLEYPVFGYALK